MFWVIVLLKDPSLTSINVACIIVQILIENLPIQMAVHILSERAHPDLATCTDGAPHMKLEGVFYHQCDWLSGTRPSQKQTIGELLDALSLVC